MRLKERELVRIEIAERACEKGPLGGVTEAFGDKISVRASVLPEDKAFSVREGGLRGGEAVKIIIPKDVSVSAGDGVFMDGDTYVVSFVRCWRAHTELECAKKP